MLRKGADRGIGEGVYLHVDSAMRVWGTFLGIILIAAATQGCNDTESSGAATASASSRDSGGSGTSGGGGGTAPISTPAPPTPPTPAPPTPAPPTPTPPTTTRQAAAVLNCGSPTVAAGSSMSGPPGVDVALTGNDLTQTYTSGSSFTIQFPAKTPQPDVLKWHIGNYSGGIITSGAFNVPKGASVASLKCSSTLAGYFVVSAMLEASRSGLPQKGSRPAGMATFGVLPNVADLLPAAASGPLDQHAFGLQGTNFVDSGVCCNGNGLQPVNDNLGSTWVLDQRAQATTEPNNAGEYNPATYPLNVGLEQGTLARIVTLNGIPAWASTAPSQHANGSYPPKSFSAYQSYTSLVGQETTRVQAEYIPNQHKNYYQVTWEPDPGPATQWMGTDSDFVSLYRAAFQGLHSTDPNAMVMGPTTMSIPACNDWLNRLAPLGFTKYLDAVSCHGYYTIGPSSALPPEPSNLPGQVQQIRQTIQNLMGAGIKLFVTETGISYPMGSKYSVSFPTADVLLQQAEAVVRTHLILLGEGVDTSFLFYSADYSYEVGFGLYFNLSMPSPDFGAPDISPKPAAMAVAAATRLIDGTRSLGGLQAMPAGAYGYSFVLSDKAHAVTALWAHSGTFNASVPYQLQVDGAGTSGTVTLLDAMGNPSSVPYSNGLMQVTLGEMPAYVISANIAALKPQLRAPVGYDSGV